MVFQKLREAFDENDFKSFKKLLSSRYFTVIKDNQSNFPFRKLRTTLFDHESNGLSVFEEILGSNRSDSFMYISFALEHFELWNNEEFFMKFGENFMERLTANQPLNIKSFFSLLAYDWFNPKPDQFYSLVTKSKLFQKASLLFKDEESSDSAIAKNKSLKELFKTVKKATSRKSSNANGHPKSTTEKQQESGSSGSFPVEKEDAGTKLFKNLIQLIDDERYSQYRGVCLRIIFQFLFEVDRKFQDEYDRETASSENSADSSVDVLNKKSLNFIDELYAIACQLKNEEFKSKITQMLAVSWISNDAAVYHEKHNKMLVDNTEPMEIENFVFYKLSLLLKEKKIIQFQKDFVTFIKDAKATHGDYFSVAIKNDVRFLSIIASKENLVSTRNFIFEEFQYITMNSTVMQSFDDVRTFTAFKVENFKDSLLEKWVCRLFQIN